MQSTLLIFVACSLQLTITVADRWFGETPGCGYTAHICKQLNLKFVEKSNENCFIGYRVRCKLPERSGQLQPEEATRKELPLKVVSVKLDEVLLKGELKDGEGNDMHTPGKTYDGHIEKSCRIPEYMVNKQSDADVLVFSDMHTQGCVNGFTLIDQFTSYGWNYNAFSKGSGSYYQLGSHIFSKWPMENYKVNFFKSHSSEKSVFKFGYQLVDLIKNGNTIKLLTVRFEKDDVKVRASQIDEFKEAIKNMKIDKKTPFLYQTNYGFENWMSEDEQDGNYLEVLRLGKEAKEINKTDAMLNDNDLTSAYCPGLKTYHEWDWQFYKGCTRKEIVTYSDNPAKVVTIKFDL